MGGVLFFWVGLYNCFIGIDPKVCSFKLMRTVNCILVKICILSVMTISASPLADVAAHSPEVQKVIKDYRSPDVGKSYSKLLKLQKVHRGVYDRLKVGESIFTTKGLIPLGEIRHEEDKYYKMTFGFSPKTASDNEAGITALIVHFDDKGVITKKMIPKYKW